MKTCSSCKELKESILFSKDARTPSGLYGSCKSCIALKAKEKRKENPELHRAAVKKHTSLNYISKLKQNAEYRKANVDKVSLWKRKDRERNRVRIANDNAKRRVLQSSVDSKDTQIVYALRDFMQAMSLGDKFHVDHIVPLAKGGKHCADNLQVIPAICNLRKGVKTKNERQ